MMGLVSGWSLANHSNSESFLVAHGIASERDSGKWMDTGCLLSTLPELSHWWWLISSIFLIRISCHKTTHANGYYGAWPGWVVSISVLPLTLFLCVCISALLLSQLNKLSLYVLSCLFCYVSDTKLFTCIYSFCLCDKCIFHWGQRSRQD